MSFVAVCARIPERVTTKGNILMRKLVAANVIQEKRIAKRLEEHSTWIRVHVGELRVQKITSMASRVRISKQSLVLLLV